MVKAMNVCVENLAFLLKMKKWSGGQTQYP